MIQKHTLDNGLRVITESIPSVRSVSIGVWVGTGSKYETRTTNGISHFIEHMMFKGTTR
nr:peptidase M16 [Bacillota bacterium]